MAGGTSKIAGFSSSYSLIAASLYLVVSAAGVGAFLTANSRPGIGWHARVWAGRAVIFALLALFRFIGLEEFIRDALRDWLRSQGNYEARRTIQRPIAAGLIVVAAAAAAIIFYRAAQVLRKAGALHGRRALAAMIGFACTAAMIILVVLRLISLSPIDALLYGPLKLNWIADIGLTLAAMGAALFYVKVARSRREAGTSR